MGNLHRRSRHSNSFDALVFRLSVGLCSTSCHSLFSFVVLDTGARCSRSSSLGFSIRVPLSSSWRSSSLLADQSVSSVLRLSLSFAVESWLDGTRDHRVDLHTLETLRRSSLRPSAEVLLDEEFVHLRDHSSLDEHVQRLSRRTEETTECHRRHIESNNDR